jgi:predicted membrane chloride channel (bestrophin family)
MMNQSYERWWEARKIWGEIVIDSRTLVMQLSMYLNPENKDIEVISHRQIAWNYSLGSHLRKVDSLQDLKKWFSDKDFESVSMSVNRPPSILSLQSQSLAKLYRDKELDKFSQIQIETTSITSGYITIGQISKDRNPKTCLFFIFWLATPCLFLIFIGSPIPTIIFLFMISSD